MKPHLALAALLLLAACGGDVAEVTVDADEAAENVTAAKTLADIAAAEQAAKAPMPRSVEPVPELPKADPVKAEAPAAEQRIAPPNVDFPQENEAAPSPER